MSDTQSLRSNSESPVIVQNPDKDTTPVVEKEAETKAPPVAAAASPVKADFSEKAQLKKDAPESTVEEKVDPMDLFRWTKPINSALVLGSGLMAYYFLFYKGYSIVTLLSYVLMVNIAINGAIVIMAKPAKYIGIMDEKTNPTKFFIYVNDLVKGVWKSDAVKHVVEQCQSIVAEQEPKIKKAMTISDGPQTTQAILSLWIASLFGRMFSISTIAMLAFISAFTYPIVYKKHGKEIDAFRAKATSTTKKLIQDVGDSIMKSAPQLEPVLIHIGLRNRVSDEKKTL